jgi:hypothetical protein
VTNIAAADATRHFRHPDPMGRSKRITHSTSTSRRWLAMPSIASYCGGVKQRTTGQATVRARHTPRRHGADASDVLAEESLSPF